ncbi:hypothetical protein J3F83DRAFT_570355 [Trichoderma novae-zelandiae]
MSLHHGTLDTSSCDGPVLSLAACFWPHQPPLQLVALSSQGSKTSSIRVAQVQSTWDPRIRPDRRDSNQRGKSQSLSRYGASGGRPFRATSSTSIKTRCNSADGAIFPCTLVMAALPESRPRALRVTCNRRRAESKGALSNVGGPFWSPTDR